MSELVGRQIAGIFCQRQRDRIERRLHRCFDQGGTVVVDGNANAADKGNAYSAKVMATLPQRAKAKSRSALRNREYSSCIRMAAVTFKIKSDATVCNYRKDTVIARVAVKVSERKMREMINGL